MSGNWLNSTRLQASIPMRYLVVGTSGSGKSRFAAALARARGCPHVELDSLHWLPGWNERSDEEFTHLVDEATQGGSWVVDGNFGKVRSLLWPRATHIVWLNYGRLTVLSRVVRRTIWRAASRQELFGGNRETFRKAFLSSDSIVLWAATTFEENRRTYAELRRADSYPHLQWLEFRRPSEAENFTKKLQVEQSV